MLKQIFEARRRGYVGLAAESSVATPPHGDLASTRVRPTTQKPAPFGAVSPPAPTVLRPRDRERVLDGLTKTVDFALATARRGDDATAAELFGAAVDMGRRHGISRETVLTPRDKRPLAAWLTSLGASQSLVQVCGGAEKALLYCASHHDRLLLQLLSDGAPVDARDARGNAASHLLAKSPDASLLRAVLAAGGAALALNDAGQTPLDISLHARTCEATLALIDAGAPVDFQDKLLLSTPLMFAAQQGNTSFVSALLARGAHIGVRNVDGRTAMDWLLDSLAKKPADGDLPRCLFLLLDAGAPLEHRHDTWQSTPLLFAAQAGQVETVRALLARGANANARSKDDTSAIAFAETVADEGSRATIVALLRP